MHIAKSRNSKRKRSKQVGFRVRMRTRNGRKIISNRRRRGKQAQVA